jgi:hypothetical protein
LGQKNQMRNLVAQQASTNAANTGADRSTMLGATGKVQDVANMLLPTVRPGGAGGPLTGSYPGAMMSPYAAATYSSNARNIADTYNNQRQMSMRALGQSGFGNSPGAIASTNNTLGRAQGAATTGAYDQALQDSLNQMVQGANIEQGVSGQYGNLATNESGMATGQAQQRVGMGSTAGDVLSGVSMLASPIMQAMGVGGFSNVGKTTPKPGASGGFNNLRAPSGVGSYGSSSGGGSYSPYAG